MQYGQSACMFHISYGFQWRQGRRYIAETCNSALQTGNDNITGFFGAPIFAYTLEVHVVQSILVLYLMVVKNHHISNPHSQLSDFYLQSPPLIASSWALHNPNSQARFQSEHALSYWSFSL